jgi:hypothetical protein
MPCGSTPIFKLLGADLCFVPVFKTCFRSAVDQKSDINNENEPSFHAIVAFINGTLHRSTLDIFSAVITAGKDRLFKNREDTLRAKARDMILRCAYWHHQRIQFQAPRDE